MLTSKFTMKDSRHQYTPTNSGNLLNYLSECPDKYKIALLKFKMVSLVDSERPKQPLESVVEMCNSGLGPHADIIFSGELE